MTNVHRAVSVLALVALIGCGSDSTGTDAGLTLNDLTGSWIAISDTYTNNANSSETYDYVADGGEVRFTMLTGGATRIWAEQGLDMDEWDAAATLSGSTLTVDPVEAGRPTRVWEVTLSGGVLTLTDANTTFDFTGMGGTPVSATEVLVVVPNI